jgi:hydroxymethylpyrimidine pyrophosphatase-like HAD family hydrolase
MRYLALACDYDGTLATEGTVDDHTIEVLQRFSASGRRLCLVTGRELDDLKRHFSQLTLFDRVVAENGALIFNPANGEERLLGDTPPESLLNGLAKRGVHPVSVGRVIVATWEPHQQAALEAIHECGLEYQVIFNKGAVMLLPSGINKAVGLKAALDELGLSAHNTVAVGDAENDHALLAACEAGVAVCNALPTLKEHADLVTESARGAGVVELCERLLASDLRELEPALTRWDIEVGALPDGEKVSVHAYGRRLLLCGTSGSGKSTFTSGFVERIAAKGYQFCLFDPEGDYAGFADAIVLGDERTPPKNEDVVDLLLRAGKSVIVNLLAVPLDQRAAAFTTLMARLIETRAQCGRPHWIVVDEAHHMLPNDLVTVPDALQYIPTGLLFVTVHPEHVSMQVLREIDGILLVGETPKETLEAFARSLKLKAPRAEKTRVPAGEVLFWSISPRSDLMRLRTTPATAERHRHRRKYAAGELDEDRSFYFRGPTDSVKLRAQNLVIFLQIADGIDDETWLHHLRQHDYSSWLRTAIKNPEIAKAVEQVEATEHPDPAATRAAIRQLIEKTYTLPA